MTNETYSSIDKIEQIVVAGASALREVLGVPVTARDVQEISDAMSDAPADGVVAQAKVEGGGSVVAVGAAADLQAAGDSEAIMTGLASQVAIAAEREVDEVAIAADLAAAGVDGMTAARFELAVDGNAVPVVVAIDETVLAPPADVSEGDGEPQTGDAPTVARASLPDLGAGSGGNGSQDLQLLADVNMKVTVELGHTDLLVRDLLALSEGSVVELDQAPGTPVDVLVNGTTVARGDVVVVDDDLGVRITEVLQRPV